MWPERIKEELGRTQAEPVHHIREQEGVPYVRIQGRMSAGLFSQNLGESDNQMHDIYKASSKSGNGPPPEKRVLGRLWECVYFQENRVCKRIQRAVPRESGPSGEASYTSEHVIKDNRATSVKVWQI
jgi:hypothetical protein